MVALTDSRWVAEDLAASVPPRGTLTVSTDVEGFNADINDPNVSAYTGMASPDWGTRTAWGKLVLADGRDVTLDATGSASPSELLLIVWSESSTGTLTYVDSLYSTQSFDLTLAAGTYLLEFCRPGRTVMRPATVTATAAAPTAAFTGAHVAAASVAVTSTTSAAYTRS